MAIAEVLTISGLIRKTGASRSSIHFYVREGLLPRPQKTAVNHSLYTDDHVRLLDKITELKQSGRSLHEIRAALSDDVARAEQSGEDLAGQQSEQVRHTILRVATEEFMTYGYRQTRVAAILRKAGVTSQVFYSHFPSKSELLVESFRTFLQWNLAFVEPKLSETSDIGERLLWRVLADFRANQLGSEVLSLVRSEPDQANDLAKLVEQAWGQVVRRIVAELDGVRKPGSPPAVSLELIAYSMIGALHNAGLRASWDDRYSREDLLGATLWLFLAILAGMSGEADVDSRFAGYKSLIAEIAARQPETPPVPQD